MWKQLLLTITLSIFTTTCTIKSQHNNLNESYQQPNTNIFNNQTLKLAFNEGRFFTWKINEIRGNILGYVIGGFLSVGAIVAIIVLGYDWHLKKDFKSI